MDYKNFTTGFNKTAVFTAQTYGTKTSVEIDHSDLSLDEVMDAFQTLLNGMGYHADGFKQWVIERAAEYQEEENEKWNDVIASMGQDDTRYENLRHNTDDKFEDWKNETPDENEFDDYGARIVTDSSFEWEDTPEDDDLFEGIEPNEALKKAVKQFSKELKKKNK
jgi:hypothetical protein